jgi:pilus assembly protein Flp/PilA
MNMNMSPKREEGQGLVEYALAIVLLAIVVMVVLTLLGPQVSGAYAKVIAGLNGQVITGRGVEYVITGFSVSVSGSPPVCNVSITGVSAIALKHGVPYSQANVSVTAGAGGGSSTLSGLTDNTGAVSLGNATFSAVGCSGTASVSWSTVFEGISNSGSRQKGY